MERKRDRTIDKFSTISNEESN